MSGFRGGGGNSVSTAPYNENGLNKNKAGGLPVGFIGQAIFPIDESLGFQRYLLGKDLIINQNSQALLKKIEAASQIHQSILADSLETWNAIKTMSAVGQVGKFFIDYENGYIRLPLIVNAQGLKDLAGFCEIVDAGLPNIEGRSTDITSAGQNNTSEWSGALKKESNYSSAAWAGATWMPRENVIVFDASLSNPIYGNSETVQQEAVQIPYFIQVAAEVEETIPAIREYEVNDPFVLLESKYSECLLYNPAWLRSNGQWNAKSVYPTAYDILLIEHNSNIEAGTTTENGYTKRGLSVKLSTEEYTDYDFVINTADETFRLPLKNGREGALIKTAPVVGNGMTLGLVQNDIHSGLVQNDASIGLSANDVSYGMPQGSRFTGGQPFYTDYTVGVTSDPANSGLVADLEAANIPENYYLYFYVGNITQNASVINAGRMQEQLVDLASRIHIVESAEYGTSGYYVRSDKYCEQWGVSNGRDSTVKFVKSYRDKGYNIQVTTIRNAGPISTEGGNAAYAIDESQARITSCGENYPAYWTVRGYLP